MKISQVNDNCNKKQIPFKAFIANEETAWLINKSITEIRSASEDFLLFGFEKAQKEEIKSYKDHYITMSEFIGYFHPKVKNKFDYLKNLLTKAKEIKIEDVKKVLPEVDKAEEVLKNAKINAKSSLGLEF